jgi:hypothetical protein
MLDKIKQSISSAILRYLSKPTVHYAPFFAPDIEVVREALRPGDIILIEGNTRLSAIIKFLTQSTWSHAALYLGDRPDDRTADGEPNSLLEADADTGVATAPLSKYAKYNLRICRAVGLSPDNRRKVIEYALARLGKQYDSKQIVDLARYLFPYPPVPVWFRRRMLAIGAGDPTKAICSTLIGEAFASVRYPILPEKVTVGGKTIGIAPFVQRETDHIRRHGLYTPRDFDVSPYFLIVKPTLEDGDFNYRDLVWAPPSLATADRPAPPPIVSVEEAPNGTPSKQPSGQP